MNKLKPQTVWIKTDDENKADAAVNSFEVHELVIEKKDQYIFSKEELASFLRDFYTDCTLQSKSLNDYIFTLLD